MNSVRFLFDGTRVQAGDSPESVRLPQDLQTFRDISNIAARCLQIIDEFYVNLNLKSKC